MPAGENKETRKEVEPQPVEALTDRDAEAIRRLLGQGSAHAFQSIEDVARQTGLSRGTAQKVVAFLEDHRFVVPDHEEPWSLRVNERRTCAIGVSIRNDQLIGVITNLRASSVLPPEHRRLSSTGVDAVVRDIGSLVLDLLDARPDKTEAVIGLGVELSGHIDGRRGAVVYSPDLKEAGEPWRHVALAELLEQETHLETVVENDANALAVHEQWFGDGRDVDDFIVLLIGGEGVGCGLVAHGNLIHGVDGIAGEIGHWVMDPGGRECRCGNRGCLERFVSAQAICEASGWPSQQPLEGLKVAAEGAREGDDVAMAAFVRGGEVLGRSISMVLNLTNPSRVILFGPPQLTDPAAEGEPARRFIQTVEEAIGQYSFSFAAWRQELVPKAVDERLGATGAASAALARIITQPNVLSGQGR
jgi:predicted NBD/HSP70 family sugar kinase